MKNAGTCLGIVAAVEVPDGLWDEFLQSMAENATQDNYQFRLASIQTLGFMSEFLEPCVPKTLQAGQVGQILHATILNIDAAHPELARIAIKALQRVIPSTANNFQNKEQRDFIMEGVLRAAQMDDDEVQEEAIKALIEIPEISYEHLGEYILQIGTITMNLMSASEKFSQIRYVLAFWTTLCREE